MHHLDNIRNRIRHPQGAGTPRASGHSRGKPSGSDVSTDWARWRTRPTSFTL